MKRRWTQKEIWDYLNQNPLKVTVHIGDLDDMKNLDYIFFDYLTDEPISADDGYSDSLYEVQFTVCTKDFENRKTLVKYIKDMFLCTVSYDHSEEHEYYVAFMRTNVFINEQ